MNNPIIEKAIEIAGGTQQKLAECSGVSQATIHKLLTGKSSDMRGSTATRISSVTGIPVVDLLNKHANKKAGVIE
ncbi:MAG: helix-turn-helix domain-containing protein [Methylobacter sp.]|uniref:helix-turn-helix domain-containing protein n=1 Tax=Methylobacter sp. TaxID=2051955 RepID=UPI0025DC4B40|nr:helix-turn-helix domain-containing protein [Methylobacter sp.]MCK9622219.1 helix-turn-helix domain-containing protein [Methylobacter sp.]